MNNSINQDQDHNTCDICYDNKNPHKTISCGHTCCYPCFYKMLFTNNNTCHMCRKTFTDDNEFKRVDLPISNFVQDSNIPFTLSITPS